MPGPSMAVAALALGSPQDQAELTPDEKAAAWALAGRRVVDAMSASMGSGLLVLLEHDTRG